MGLWFGAMTARALPWSDNLEGGIGSWSTNGTWGLTDASSRSPTHAVTDSPGAFYANSSDSAVATASGVDLSAATRPAARFYSRYALEPDYDFLQVEVSTNAGAAWSSLIALTGNQPSWKRTQLTLADYAGAADVRLRFHLLTDSSVVMDGVYIDDVLVGEAPASTPVVSTFASQTMVRLEWQPSADPECAGYHLYRALGTNASVDAFMLVASISDPAATSWTDIAVSPKSAYSYDLKVWSSNELESASSIVVVQIPAGMDFPFLDNGEGGGGMWIADAPWGLGSAHAFSPTHAWSDSPAGNYTNGQNVAITLSSPMSLAGTARPILNYTHRYDLLSGDNGLVEYSTNNGVAWAALATYTANSTSWRRVRHDLSAHAGASQVLIRFRLTTDGSGTADGWWVDDISVSESLDAVPAPVIDQVQSHSLRLTWAQNTNLTFSHYSVFRSAAPGAGINSTLVTTLYERTTTSVVDTNLALDTMYYYRVYAVNPWGGYSADSPLEAFQRTANHPVPYSDDFEGSLIGWNLSGIWSKQTNDLGGYMLTDSPHTVYSNNYDSSAITAVDLQNTTWPVLKFRDRFDMGAGDWFRLEISAGGYPTYYICGVHGTGSRSNWVEQAVDLSIWKGAPNVQLRFRLSSNNDGLTGDGWLIDHVRIEEQTPLSLGYPFYERFEESPTNRWLVNSWVLTTNGPCEGASAVSDSEAGIRTAPDTYYLMNLAGGLNLTGAVNPRVTYWVKGNFGSPAYVHHALEVSVNGGASWSSLNYLNEGFNAGWTRYQVDLTSYRSTNTRFRLWSLGQYGSAPASDIALDKLSIEEAPPPVSLDVPVPHLKSVDVSWGLSTIGAEFARYELYRSTDGTVTPSDTLIGSFSDVNSNSITDVGLSIGATYYYGVFVVNTSDTYSVVSSRPATTVPLTLPFADGMENLDTWDRTGSWGPDSNIFSSGTASLNESPNANYAPSSDSHVLTAVNLQNTTWPVLKFRDRFDLGAGDWFRLEVSANGYPTYYMCGVHGAGSRSNWAEQAVDLSVWKGAPNVQIKFRVAANSDGSTGDGWFVDDVRIEEHAPLDLNYPFYERFEEAPSNFWLGCSWMLSTNGAYEGARAVIDSDPSMRTAPDTYYLMNLAGGLNLTGAVNPRLTYWVKGNFGSPAYVHHSVEVSVNGGSSWANVNYLNEGFNAGWTRYQVDLTSYRSTNTRFRLWSLGQYGSAPASDIALDKLSIEEAPEPVVLYGVTAEQVGELRLDWSGYSGGDFLEYRVYRSTSASVTESSPLVATIPAVGTTNLVDTGLDARTVYYYKVFVRNTNDTSAGSNQSSARTLGVPLGWSDDGESLQAAWTRTGQWAVQPGAGRGGSAALVDSVGDYAINSDTYMQTAVDLTTAQWPVLRFWDRFAIGGGDWIALDIWAEGGPSQRVYGTYESTRSDWREQAIDLSPWKGYGSVYIRFRLGSNGSTPADGWTIDDISITEHSRPPAGAPFFDGFEAGTTNWLAASWASDPADPYQGGASVRDTGAWRHMLEGAYFMNLAHALDLTTVSNPVLTIQVRGVLDNYSDFRVQISTNSGTAWTELSAFNLSYGFNSAWTRKQASLLAYRGTNVRLRCFTSSYWNSAPSSDFFVDNFGIGDGAPGAPSLLSPAMFDSVGVLRPTLVVGSAVDSQSDPLTYRFEVFDDADLSNVVAQVPAVAEGDPTTSWQLDVTLTDNAQYWWRCRAYDGSNDGPWMATATFYVNETNAAPLAVSIAGPPKGATLRTATGILSWYPTTDPDVGDDIVLYHIQIDDDPGFGGPEVSAQFDAPLPPPTSAFVTISRPLTSLTGSESLGMISNYFWRIRAQDSRFAWSPWTASGHWFIFGVPPPDAATFTRGPGSALTFTWEVGTENFFVEWAPSITGQWESVAGPLGVNSWSFTPSPAQTCGFYRVKGE